MLRIVDSYPALTYADLERLESRLAVALPTEYRDFLLRYNGGFIDVGVREFSAPISQVRGDRVLREVKDSVEEFFGYGDKSGAERSPGCIVELNSEYAVEEFLPSDVLVVARCASDSLLCLSTRAESFGEVYYWYYYWRYPWAAGHFEAAVEATRRRYPAAAEMLTDPTASQMIRDAFNYATLTLVSSDFNSFLASLRPESEFDG